MKNDFGKCSFLVLSAKAMDEKIKTWTLCFPAKENPYVEKAMSGCKENHFTAHHWGKMKLEFTSPDVISTSPRQNFKIFRGACPRTPLGLKALGAFGKYTCLLLLSTHLCKNLLKPLHRLWDITFFARCIVQLANLVAVWRQSTVLIDF